MEHPRWRLPFLHPPSPAGGSLPVCTCTWGGLRGRGVPCKGGSPGSLPTPGKTCIRYHGREGVRRLQTDDSKPLNDVFLNALD